MRPSLRQKRCWFALAATLVAAVVSPTARAQDEVFRFDLAWRGVPLERALEEFATSARLDLVFDPPMVRGRTVYCVARDLSAEDVLRCLLRGTGLDFHRRSSGTYVVVQSAEAPPLYGNLRGIVVDGLTRQPVANAHVLLAEATRGRVANENGMFTFYRLLPGEYHMTVSHTSYRTVTTPIEVSPGSNNETEVVLEVQTYLVTPIVVDGLGMQPSSTLLGQAVMEQEALAAETGLSGVGTISRLDALAGVRVNDATSEVHIQGGEAGEHQFRLDGAPVFIPLNVASFVGPFSPFALGRITVNKAGFGTPLGSHISGVIEAEHDLRFAGTATMTGGRRSFTSGLVQWDPLSLNGRFSGYTNPPNGPQVAWMGAARYGLWRWTAPAPLDDLLDGWNRIDTFLLSAFASRNTPFADLPPVGEPEVAFLDLHAASRVRFSPLRSIYASAFFGRSKLGNDLAGMRLGSENGTLDDPAGFGDVYTWRNGTAQIRYDAVLGPRSLGSLRWRGSMYRLRHDFESRDDRTVATGEDDGNRVWETAVEARMDYSASDRHYVELGTDLVLTSDRFVVAGTQLLPLRHRYTGLRWAGFTQHTVQTGRHLAFAGGSRFTYVHARRSLYAEPRLSARADWPDTKTGTWSAFIGTGLYRQFQNQFDVSSRSPRTFVSSTRFWLAVDSTVAPPKSAHLAGEIHWRPTLSWSLGIEGHLKRHYHILALDYAAASRPGNQGAASFLRASHGVTRGFGATLQRSIGIGTVRVRYERTFARRTSSGLFRDESLTVPWSEPHRFELALDVMPLPGLVLLARWRTVRGRTWGYRQAYYDFLSAYLVDLEAMLEELRKGGVSGDALARIERQVTHYDLVDPESHRLPSLDQLDVSVAYGIPIGRTRLQARVDVVNVLGRENVADWRFLMDEDQYYGLGSDPGSSGILDRGVRDLLPRVVSVALKLAW